MSVEDRVKSVFQKVLDVKPEEIEPSEKLQQSLGVDSTEMVEICVGLKKEFNIPLADSDIKKTQSFNEIVGILKTKGAQ